LPDLKVRPTSAFFRSTSFVFFVIFVTFVPLPSARLSRSTQSQNR